MLNCKICGQPVTCGLVVHDGCYEDMDTEIARLCAELERVKKELDAAVAAVDRMDVTDILCEKIERGEFGGAE